MKTGLMMAGWLMGSLMLARPAYVRTETAGARWAIGNDFVERTIGYSQAGGLRTEGLVYKFTGRDFTAFRRGEGRYGDEFNLQAGTQGETGKSFVFEGAEAGDVPGGKSLRITGRTSDGGLGIAVEYVVYDDAPALRKWIAVTNRGARAVTLSHVSFEALAAGPGGPNELAVKGGYGATPRELYFTGRVADPAIFVRNAATGEGFAILNEAPGYLKRTEVGEWWKESFRAMYDTDLFPFERTLEVGETFESAKCSLVFFSDGKGLADAHWAVPGYVARHVRRRQPEERPAWIFNTWEPFLRKIDEKTVAELAPVAKQMRMDIFTIDDGWQADYGANEVDRGRFPGGFAGIHSTLEQNRLRLGLWVPLAAIDVKTKEYRTHPEWVCRDRGGKPKFTQTAAGQSAVMCLGSGYREAALRRLEDLIARYRPAYIKVDLTTVFNTYGEAPGCYAAGHAHRNWAESLTRIYEGLEYIGRRLYRDHPEVLVDYTFELWGEKHLIDPGLLGCADLDWLSNVYDEGAEAGGALHARSLLYQRAPSIPVETMLIGNLRAPTGSKEEHFGTAIGSGPLLLGDLRKLTPEEREWYGEKIRWFQGLRARASLEDSFFGLGSWEQPNAAAWDGFARLSRESDGTVVLFANRSGVKEAEVRIVTPAGARYRVRSERTGRDLGEVSGEELGKGWRVHFGAGVGVEVLELVRVGG